MKIEKLNSEYLLGLIDMSIANFSENCVSVPESLSIKPVLHSSSEKGVCIKVYWTTKQIGDETNFVEDLQEHDTIFIYKGEKIIDLQMKVEAILYHLTR